MKIDKKTLRDLYVRMSWVLLEHNVVYFYKSDFGEKFEIDKTWISLREINDIEYDRKWYFYVEFCNAFDFMIQNEVSFDPSRPSVKVILQKMSKPAEAPILWPSEAEQIYLHALLLSKLVSKKKNKLRSA